jgi:hypothetical protein
MEAHYHSFPSPFREALSNMTMKLRECSHSRTLPNLLYALVGMQCSWADVDQKTGGSIYHLLMKSSKSRWLNKSSEEMKQETKPWSLQVKITNKKLRFILQKLDFLKILFRT